ncbi:MAG: Fis family transcriptional regulator [SAR86 cluster bacterium]|uniref:Fis family transcriptional regulator n=1 Tax=SAR86 cluster bacterium TaxID=2030880 RepID=A0A2A5B7R5_9GAMM|nr:MAG: Fis family transcriptional regulator [SAR86 cluster bacterium]
MKTGSGVPIEELESLYQLILDSAGEGVYGLGNDGKITFSNAAATKILGWESDQVLGQQAHDVHHHSHADGTPYPKEQCPIYAALKDGETHRVNNEVFWHTNGKPIPVSYVSTPIIRDGKPDGAVILFKDDSQRRELEQQRQCAFEELEKLRTDYQLILDAAGEGIYGLDSDGLITFSNAASTAILGWKGEDVLGRSSHEIHHHTHADGSNYPREQCPIYAAITDGEVHHVENEVFWHTDGSPVPVEYTSTPILRDGKPVGAVVVFRNVSDRKALEKQRENAYEEIKQLKEKLELERDYLRDEVNTAGKFGEIIGESEAIKRTLAQVEAVAQTPASVLILGESGVGKEMIARAIHTQSDRADKPMVKVNCASIPNELFESEFFGHVKGAFTGAHQDRVGRLQLADGGTLFLDEVGEIPIAQQGKLLRALQEGEFERVGDHKTIHVNVRVVAATNRKLEEEIKAGHFREDLFYRLSVFPIEVPPLRDRVSDIVPLATAFLKNACEELGRKPLKLTQSHATLLEKHNWPGNIRELKNTIDRAVISSTDKKLRLDLALTSVPSEKQQAVNSPVAVASSYLTNDEFKELEKANIIAALQHSNWKTWGDNGAAVLLGIKASTLAYQMKMFGIKKPVNDE